MTAKPKVRIGPTPERLAASGTEHGHQTALFCWAAMPDVRALYPELSMMFAIPNGGARGDDRRSNKIRGGMLKAEGVKPGVPDVLLPVKRGQWSGLFIELKRPRSDGKAAGRASDEQSEWIPKLQAQGFGAMTAHGFEAARDAIVQYLEYRGA
jgi:hypothetical protein